MDSMYGMNNNKMNTMNELVMLHQFDQMMRGIALEVFEENRGRFEIINRNQAKKGRRTNLRT